MTARPSTTGVGARIDAVLDRFEPPPGALAFALRVWTAMVLALFVAFWLQLESASSAAVCVAILAQTTRGQALSKAFYRFLATLVGFAVSIAIARLLGQDRVLLLVAAGSWLALCIFAANNLEGTRAYGAALSGYTVSIIAVANIDAPLAVFVTGIDRVAAITVGILAIAFVNDASASPLSAARVRGVIREARDEVRGLVRRALDGEVARAWLRPRFGQWWFPVFAVPYLATAFLVLLAWRLAPLTTLAGFLALSVRHFGEEDAGPDKPFETFVRGGLPVAMPTLVHPGAVATLFSTVATVPLHEPPTWLMIASWCWVPPALFWFARAVAQRRWPSVAEAAGLTGAFVILPPLAAFGLYFVCLHAPRHVRVLIADPHRAPRVDGAGAAVVRSLPITGLMLLIGAALWPRYDGSAPERLTALTLQGLAALTLPHMILDGILQSRSRRHTSSIRRSLSGSSVSSRQSISS